MSGSDWDAFARYLAGESDPVESGAVERWLATHPEDAALAALVKARVDRAEVRSELAVDTEGALAAVHRRMTEVGAAPALTVSRGGRRSDSDQSRNTVAPVTRSWRTPLVALAAGLVAMVGIAQWRGQPSSVASREYATAVGQRDSVRLPDGSRVILAPGSRLTVAAGFNAANRVVTLEGAAFFEVEHDGAHPFLIHARGAEIRDIGTAFSVKTDRSGRVSVAVTHGIVALRDSAAGSAPAVELGAGDRGVLQAGAVTVARGTVTDADIAWTRGELAYRDAPLAEVQADLRRWYGLELQVTDSILAGRTLTAAFRGDSSAQVVRLIALALGADVTQRGDTLFLQPQGPGSTRIP